MVDPVSLGIAAAAILATRYGEELAGRAAAGSWDAVVHLREVIARKLGRGHETSPVLSDLALNPSARNQLLAAAVIDEAADSDVHFAAELRRHVESATRSRVGPEFIANANDSARQVNLRGDNIGTIIIE